VRADGERLLDILEAIAAIQEQAQAREQFDADKMPRVWTRHV
jgi:hypothetical protein